MNWPCTRCGSRNWPDPESSCPLCNDGREEPREALGDPLEAREQALERFTREGCWFTSAQRWWEQIDKQTEGTGKVLTVHLPAILAQLRKAGYSVKQAKRKRPEVILLEMAGIMAALERMDA